MISRAIDTHRRVATVSGTVTKALTCKALCQTCARLYECLLLFHSSDLNLQIRLWKINCLPSIRYLCVWAFLTNILLQNIIFKMSIYMMATYSDTPTKKVLTQFRQLFRRSKTKVKVYFIVQFFFLQFWKSLYAFILYVIINEFLDFFLKIIIIYKYFWRHTIFSDLRMFSSEI